MRYFRERIPAEVEAFGFGFAVANIEMIEAGPNTMDSCPFEPDQARLNAFDTAVALFLASDGAKQAYGNYGRCMSGLGYLGLGHPRDAELLIMREMASIIDANSEGDLGASEADLLPSVESLLETERAILMASARCESSTIGPAANELVDAQREVIESAPEEQRLLLEF